MSDYKGTMTTENLAGKVSARIWPAYLMAKRDSGKGAPTTIALAQELYTEMIKLVEGYQVNTKRADGKKTPKDEMFGMQIVHDEALAEGEWELRWGA